MQSWKKSPEHIHTYRISPLSLWNAAASGLTDRNIIETLLQYSRYDIPEIVLRTIREQMQRYGMLKLEKEGDDLILTSKDPILLNEILNHRKVQTYLEERLDGNRARVIKNFRGHIKQALIKIGFPVEDLAGYEEGEPCPINLRDISLKGQSFEIRDYQHSAIKAFYRGGGADGGSGIIVLPCGAGKTIVAIGEMALQKTAHPHSCDQHRGPSSVREELLDKTDWSRTMIRRILRRIEGNQAVTIRRLYNILTYIKKQRKPLSNILIYSTGKTGGSSYTRGAHPYASRLYSRIDVGNTVQNAPWVPLTANPHHGGRPGKRWLQPHRPQEIRHAWKDPGEMQLDSTAPMH